jgi:hypothetical protein
MQQQHRVEANNAYTTLETNQTFAAAVAVRILSVAQASLCHDDVQTHAHQYVYTNRSTRVKLMPLLFV